MSDFFLMLQWLVSDGLGPRALESRKEVGAGPGIRGGCQPSSTLMVTKRIYPRRSRQGSTHATHVDYHPCKVPKTDGTS